MSKVLMATEKPAAKAKKPAAKKKAAKESKVEKAPQPKVRAVLAVGGKQYVVAVGDTLCIPPVADAAGSTISLKDVLLVSAEESGVKLGSAGKSFASVTAKVVGPVRGEKVTIYKKRRRKGYSKKIGHRQDYTKVVVQSIDA
jgi:large subunit ribosomal protein L21